MTKKYYAVWFSDGNERTAKLILDTERFPLRTTVEQYSRLYPVSESRLMKRCLVSGTYDTWIEAFHQRSRYQDALLGRSDQFYAYTDGGVIAGVAERAA